MQGFVKHNINHTSPSSINMWAEAPDAWVAKYVLGAKFSFSPAARAGVLAEKAVVNVLCGMGEAAAIDAVLGEFNQATVFDKSDKTLARRDMIAPMVKLAVAELKQYGEPEFDNGNQKKIEINCRVDDWTIPVIGYLDFHFPQHGLVIDLKTTSRMPSEMSAAHLRQQAVYRAAMANHAVKFLYVTPKKAAMYEPESTDETLAQIKSILRRQNNFLLAGDAETLRGIVPVSDSYYWSDDLPMRRDLYGM